MEKYAQDSLPSPEDYESATLINKQQTSYDASRRRSYVWLTLANLFVFTISMLSLICAIVSQRNTSGHSVAKLMDEFDAFSPAMHEVEYSNIRFALPEPLNSSKYVGISNETEDAWMDIAYLPDQMVSASDFPKLQMPSDALQVTDPKTGEKGYRVGLEVFHQLHCLNLLREATHPEHYKKMWWSDTNDKPEKVRAHMDHCIEILRMNLMCHSDIHVFTFHPVEGKEGYWPNYNSNRVCRNFDHIKKWAIDHAMPEADV